MATCLVTKMIAVGAIEILAAGKVVKIKFPVDLEGQIDGSYNTLFCLLLQLVGSKKKQNVLCVYISE
jgi:hypothetical protein